uniref:Uncharacterized protein n=1 Tax=Pyrodinium bahamense TaxID=73915 RepID=A0A7S0AVJ9_9DINO|mmetsp:Transcript_43079/g.119857  ORF Transcript_43079/g.119857 Transcript_43079/m.119857 type:complete len:215 (+) Transcript_43079:112-756(+)|eukprot:CAMPEP_0179025334 /NCGR_PEP_ID=MMETSP0796-20121207/7926_1 /TAXON_ID=73915 /ORGANISM="Pyrodinium bahamense, Strain pbaha01" /LENGTH=214 /DNA_ID=CAMNT_0020721341 /DNA_START=89 /DNA_END=733 /DNA_ORIENTATION=-
MFCKCECRPTDVQFETVKLHYDPVDGEHELEEGDAQELAARHMQGQEAYERVEEEEEKRQRHLSEEQRLLEEAQRAEEEAQERVRLEEEERLRLEREVEARREALRLWQEKEMRERRKALDLFYQQNGFLGINEPRRSGCSVWAATVTYPLHWAAELADACTVEMLLKEGADVTLKNSAGKTALQVAQKRDRGGSHESVLRLLGPEAKPRVGGA